MENVKLSLFRFFRTSSPKSDLYKRPPLRTSNGFHSPHGSQPESGRKILEYIRRIGVFLFFATVIATIILSVAFLVLYVNCSNADGVEIIPKSRQLCHDVYQLLQTGRLLPLTWDWKASCQESIRRFHRVSTSIIDWIKNFDLIVFADAVVSFFEAVGNAVIAIPSWVCENGCQIVQLAASLVLEVWSNICAYAIGAFQFISHFIFGAYEWLKSSTIDFCDNIPVYWKKTKNYWKK